MVTYEVTAKVGSHLTGEYERFMRDQHIPDVLNTGAFTSASFHIAIGGLYQMRYEAESRESLERYLNEDADALRKDLIGRFPDGIEFSRREWDLIQTWKC
jgi:hypothetical protein